MLKPFTNTFGMQTFQETQQLEMVQRSPVFPSPRIHRIIKTLPHLLCLALVRAETLSSVPRPNQGRRSREAAGDTGSSPVN